MFLGDSTIFDRLYAKLNNRQKEAVDAIEGPVMVVAGPGTGKTQILTLRIANIRRLTDTPPDAILALTFTESGVASMRKRLTEIIGNDAYRVCISTFHGFCNDIIGRYPDYFPSIIGSTNSTTIDQVQILESIINERSFKKLKPFGEPFYYIGAIKEAIDTLKRENISPDAFEHAVGVLRATHEANNDKIHTTGAHKGKIKGEYIKQKETVEKNEDLAIIYHSYQEALRLHKWYDYSDMIMEVVRAFNQNVDLLSNIQERFAYILVDEHQDTNNAQNKLLELLCSFDKKPNLFVVGDEKQAIFRFQGASLENFLYFKTLYPEAKLVVLEDNYRSTQLLLDATHGIARVMSPKAAQLKSHTTHENKKITVHAFSRPDVEYYFIATAIKTLSIRGVPLHEVVVLYRDNRDVFPIAHLLEKQGIPFTIESDQDVLSDNNIRKFITLARAVERFGEEESLVALLHIDFLGIDPLDVYKIIAYASKNNTSLYSCLASKEIHRAAGIAHSETLSNIYNTLSEWARVAKNDLCVPVCETLIRESGLLAHVLAHTDAIEKMEKINGLFDEIKEFATTHPQALLADVIRFIDALQEHHILIKKKSFVSATERVRLMTAHRSKGMEFDYVFVTHAYDTHWGNKRQKTNIELPQSLFSLSAQNVHAADENDDERRLFYVALTRAKKEVMISYAEQNTQGRQQLPTQFISECANNALLYKDVADIEKDFEKNKEIIFAKTIPVGPRPNDTLFVKELFEKEGLSVTALNNYLSCPWKYFYTNLLRVPKAKTKHQLYGTAIHAALKDFFEDRLAHASRDGQWLARQFEHYMQQQPLSQRELEESKEKGVSALNQWWEYYHHTWPEQSIQELSVKGVLLSDSVCLTGKIDKIELDKNGHVACVVDYKTGKPKSRGDIEGSTKGSNGDIKRQLVFYKILLDEYHDGAYAMTCGEIDFIEPNERGIFKKERFEITQDDVKGLKETITKVADEIMNVRFWDRRCDDKECPFCSLRDLVEGKKK